MHTYTERYANKFLKKYTDKIEQRSRTLSLYPPRPLASGRVEVLTVCLFSSSGGGFTLPPTPLHGVLPEPPRYDF